MSIIKTSLLFLLVIGLMTGAFYWYFRYSQNKIQILEENNAKLTVAVQVQTETIKAQEEFNKKQNQNISDLQNGLQKAYSDKDALVSKLFNTDLNSQAQKNAKAVENKINADTSKLFDELEALTGSKTVNKCNSTHTIRCKKSAKVPDSTTQRNHQ